MEEYREIKGFEGLYEVSNYGNVRSLKRNIILNPSISNFGYYQVILCKDGKHYLKTIHRLVAIAFIPNPYNLPCVNHKDENPQNNHVDNLEWCTQKYNINYGTRNKRVAERLTNYPLTSKAVVAIDDDGNVVHEFASTAEAGRNGFNQRHISTCCRGLRRTHGGFRWYFKEDWEKIKIG